MTSDQLRIYQVLFSTIGVAPDSIAFADGVPGPATLTALRAYQTQKRIPVTGAFDAVTRQNLDNDVVWMTRQGRPIVATAQAAAQANASTHTMLARPAARPASAVGTHPKVNTIATTTGPVAVPDSVSKMIPPATVQQLQTMPAAAAQSFVNDLSNKVATGQVSGNDLVDGGTGKDMAVTAVPVVGPNGTVTAALAVTPAGWWDAKTDNEKVAWIAGGTIGGVALIAGIVWLAKGK